MLPNNVEQWSARANPRVAARAVPGKVALACSFQKEETVLLDMLFALDPHARVFGIDTHYLFPETYAHWREVEQAVRDDDRGLRGAVARELAAAHGENVWEPNPDLYLAVAKIGPLVRALGDLDAWITGVRRDQSPTRANAPKLGGTSSTSSGRRTRSPTGATRTAGPTSANAASRTTRCTTRATRRSATRTRRSPAKGARAAGPGPTRSSAASTRSRRKT